MARSLNKVQLIGNLTRDPELRYTPKGTAVATFSLATNRQWKTEGGEQKEDVEYHRLVVWDKLAEICNQFLKKGSKAFFEGRLQTRSWQAQDGAQKQTTEIVVTDMIILDNKRDGAGASPVSTKEEDSHESSKEETAPVAEEEINLDDIPF